MSYGRCYLCGRYGAIERHHIDWHHENNDSGNRISLCMRCHVELHKIGYLSFEELLSMRDRIQIR